MTVSSIFQKPFVLYRKLRPRRLAEIVLTLDSTGKMKGRNLWGAKQDELIATDEQFTLCDHLGSVRDVVGANGKVLNHIRPVL